MSCSSSQKARGSRTAHPEPAPRRTSLRRCSSRCSLKLDTTPIHFKGAGPMVAAVVAGKPPVGCGAISGPLAQIKGGKLRGLAVSSSRRLASLPDVPTLGELGFQGMEDYTWIGLFLPAGTPPDVAPRLNGGQSRRPGARHPRAARGTGVRAGRRVAARVRRLREGRDREVGQGRARDRGEGRLKASPMHIVAINEAALPVRSAMRNAVFDFAEMTTSVVAVVTDVKRDGKPVDGLRVQLDRPLRLRAADARALHPAHPRRRPEALLDEPATNFRSGKDPRRDVARREAGWPQRASIAIGTIEVAVWDAVAKIAGKPLHRGWPSATTGHGATSMFGYVGGGWYRPGRRSTTCSEEMRPPSRRRLHDGEDEGRRTAARRDVPARRGGARGGRPRDGARGRRQRASSAATRRSPTRRRWRRSGCAGSRSRPTRPTSRSSPRSPRPTRRRSRPARTCTRPRTSRTSCASAAGAPIATSSSRPAASLRHRAVRAHARHAGAPRLAAHLVVRTAATRCRSQIAAGLGLGGAESYPGRVRRVRRLRRRRRMEDG